jgi:dihydroxyacetone kinase-like predicted kinase
VERLDVADMHEQEEQRTARLAGGDEPAAAPVAARCGVVAVAAGGGMRTLYEELGAYVVEGGATLNPSTFELLAGIHEVSAHEVVVLPNSANVIMAAERAAELSEKDVAVVESRWPQAGLVCLVEHDSDSGVEENVQRLRAALDGVRTGAVAPAARDDKQGRFHAGEAVGFVDEEIAAWGPPAETLRAVLAQLAEGRELVTCVAGDGAPLDDAAIERLAPGGVEVECLDGGQPHYWWLLAAE